VHPDHFGVVDETDALLRMTLSLLELRILVVERFALLQPLEL
jgi:hypothetical protein